MTLRTRRMALSACAAGVLLLAGAAPGGAQRDGGPRVPGARHASASSSSTIIVGFRGTAKATARAALVDGLGHETADSLDLRRAGVRAELIELRDGESAAAAIARYERDPLVEFAEPNGRWHASATPNDPRFPALWGLHNTGQTIRGTAGTAGADIDAPQAWDLTTGSPSVVVAVVDSGVQYTHPDLAPNMWTNPGESANGLDDDGNGYVDDVRGWDWTTGSARAEGSGDNDPMDDNGHGTHVAGTIGARGNDGYGVAGVTWNAKLMPLRVLDREGSGDWWAVAKAFTYARVEGADVVNASLGGSEDSQLVADAVANAPGTLFVFAAGNEGLDNGSEPAYPCNYAHANVVCVAASTSSDGLASFSNYGDLSVDLAAPGTSILSTYLPLVVQDELDANADRWTFGGTGNTWGWAAGGYLSDSPLGSYGTDVNSHATFNDAVDLSASSGCALTYFLRIDVEEDFDFVAPEVSINGGASWQQVGDGWTGSTDGEWFFISEAIGNRDGEDDVRIRFSFFSDELDEGGPYDGVEIDDVGIHCATSPAHLHSHVAIDGTSMATPHVAGAAALLKARRPLATAAQIKSALLQAGDLKPAFAGRTVTGRRLNVNASMQLLKTVPHAPTGVTAVPNGTHQATLRWVPPSDGGSPISGYVVTPFIDGTARPSTEVGATTETLIHGLEPGVTYTFTVRARNAVGDGPMSAPTLMKLLTHPWQPNEVVATAGNGQATVRWTPSPIDGGSPITTYVLTPQGTVFHSPLQVGNVTQTVVTGLVNGATYRFRVAARNGIGEGPWAISNQVTPRAPVVPVVPLVVTVAGAAKVSPAKPKAGRAVVVTVRMTRDGAPVRPARLACAGAIAKAAVKGTARRAAGSAKCTYRTPLSAKGKRLKGSVSFTAGGKRFTKRFSVKLR